MLCHPRVHIRYMRLCSRFLEKRRVIAAVRRELAIKRRSPRCQSSCSRLIRAFLIKLLELLLVPPHTAQLLLLLLLLRALPFRTDGTHTVAGLILLGLELGDEGLKLLLVPP